MKLMSMPSPILKVLDHGFVQMVEYMGSDESIVRSARVSHAANEKTGADLEADKKLIHYLYRNKHTSPFEHVNFTFHVKAPIFVFRQWHRHRTWSYNEVSARYTELPAEFYVPLPSDLGKQSTKNHQARDLDEDYKATAKDRDNVASMMMHNKQSFQVYQNLLEDGVPRELARSVLPVATYSEMFASVDLHNFLKFCTERMSPHAQYEIQVYAAAMLSLAEQIVPNACNAWREVTFRD